MEYPDYDTEELAAYFSDYHKDVHGVRPRWVDHTDRVAVVEGIDALNRYMESMRATPEGRAQLRAAGWWVEQED